MLGKAGRATKVTNTAIYVTGCLMYVYSKSCHMVTFHIRNQVLNLKVPAKIFTESYLHHYHSAMLGDYGKMWTIRVYHFTGILTQAK